MPRRPDARSSQRPDPAARAPSPKGRGGKAREGRSGAPSSHSGGPPLNDAARDLAIRRIALQARRFPDLVLSDFDTASLPPRDAAFAHAIYDAVIRRWLTLSYILNLRLSKPLSELEPKVAAVLMAGAAQLLLMDRVPPHAAINHAAEWAKRIIRPGAAGLVNAVLRRTAALRAEGPRRETWNDALDELPLADGTALPLTEAILPKDPLERLSVATSTAEPILDAWSRWMPPAEVRAMALHGLSTPPVVLNTMHAAAPLPPAPLLEPHTAPGHQVFTGTHAELIELLTSRADIWVQDAASSLPVASISDLRPRLILDLCAGQGTKTRQLAAIFPDARIIATDIDPARFRTLQSVFHAHPRVEVIPAAGVASRYRNAADLILLDVPCSNSGVLARRPEAKYRFDDERQASLVSLQRQILADALPLLATAPARGVILYSTCSIEPQENHDQAAWAAQWHAFRPQREQSHPPTGGPGQEAHRYSDASFSVLLA